MSNWCLSIFMTGLNHWIILSQKEMYDRLHFEKFLYKNFFIENTFFRNHHSWWIYFRNHIQTSVCEIFFKDFVVFENFIFSRLPSLNNISINTRLSMIAKIILSRIVFEKLEKLSQS